MVDNYIAGPTEKIIHDSENPPRMIRGTLVQLKEKTTRLLFVWNYNECGHWVFIYCSRIYHVHY
jgi:hypothetical protein